MTLAHEPDWIEQGDHPELAAPADCGVEVTSIADNRVDPDIIGIYMGKAVKAPTDRLSWLKGKVRLLRLRGVEPVFVEPDGASSDIRAAISLEKAWVTTLHMDIAVSVVFRVDEPMADGTNVTNRFRGTQQKMTYFDAGEGKIQRGVNSAFDQALDAMAKHFLARCNGGSTT